MAGSKPIVATPKRPNSNECSMAFEIASGARRSCHELFSLFNQLRIGQQGVTTDQHQDILRSMLVFASAGVDATLKQLVRDCLDSVVEKSDGAKEEFASFTLRFLKAKGGGTSANDSSLVNIKNLSSILSSSNPRQELLNALKYELTSDSLQSVDAMLKVLSNFAIGPADLNIKVPEFKSVFNIRNQIVHEMDVNFQDNRSRRQRKKDEMLVSTNSLLNVSFRMIEKVDQIIASNP